MKGLAVGVDRRSARPVYRQIADGLRAQLVVARFAPGQPLPTVRTLAAELGVHHNTVAEAYRTLAEEGWLTLIRGRGATVRARAPQPPARGAQERFTRQLRELFAQALAEGLSPRVFERALAQLRKEGLF